MLNLSKVKRSRRWLKNVMLSESSSEEEEEKDDDVVQRYQSDKRFKKFRKLGGWKTENGFLTSLN